MYGALSDVEYTLTVTDTQTGAIKTYYNPAHNQAGAKDVQAFPWSGTSPAAYPIVDTGQTKFYNTSAEIQAPAPGQSFYGQDAQFLGHQPSHTLSSDGKTVSSAMQ